MEYITVTVEEGIGTIMIERYNETRNAFDDQVKSEIMTSLEECRSNEDVRAVLFRTEGDVFSSGGDLGEGGQNNHTVPIIKDAAADWEDLFMSMITLGKPTIAAVDGDVIAGAVDFLIFTDFVIAQETADFVLPEVYMSHVDWFNVATLPHLIGVKKAFNLIMTGGPISAIEAEDIGLITNAVPETEFEESIDELLASLKKATPTMLRILKESIYANANLSPAEAYMRTKMVAMQNLRENSDFKDGFNKQL